MDATASATSRLEPIGLVEGSCGSVFSADESALPSFVVVSDAPSAAEAGVCPAAGVLLGGWLEDASSIVPKSEADPWLAAPP